MWGMAEEMGLDFVDLDTVGVDFTEAGTIPEATARHHNVIVIANDDGTPVVAASNPTDVFAMDDLRTIMGRNFIVVVATRSQISSYIGRAFNSGGDAADMAMEASLGFDGSEAHADVDDIQAVTEEAPDRPLCQPAHPAGAERASLGHSRRADGNRAPHSLSDRWGAPRRVDRPAVDLGGRHHPPEGHGRHERCRAPDPPGRSDLSQRGEQGDRPPDRHSSHHPR